LNLIASPYSLYANTAPPTSIGVECSKYNYTAGMCAGFAGGSPGMPRSNISWVSQANYNAAVNHFVGLGCIPMPPPTTLPTFTGISLSTIDAGYYDAVRSGVYLGAGTASIALFC
jgi:hypothetical protein